MCAGPDAPGGRAGPAPLHLQGACGQLSLPEVMAKAQRELNLARVSYRESLLKRTASGLPLLPWAQLAQTNELTRWGSGAVRAGAGALPACIRACALPEERQLQMSRLRSASRVITVGGRAQPPGGGKESGRLRSLIFPTVEPRARGRGGPSAGRGGPSPGRGGPSPGRVTHRLPGAPESPFSSLHCR